MAVGHGILRSHNLVLILYIYLILGGITFKYGRINPPLQYQIWLLLSSLKNSRVNNRCSTKFAAKESQENRYQSQIYYLLE